MGPQRIKESINVVWGVHLNTDTGNACIHILRLKYWVIHRQIAEIERTKGLQVNEGWTETGLSESF